MSNDLAPKQKKLLLKLYGQVQTLMKHKFYAVFEVKDPIQMKTFGDREDIAKAKEEAGAFVASTKIISSTGKDFIPT